MEQVHNRLLNIQESLFTRNTINIVYVLMINRELCFFIILGLMAYRSFDVFLLELLCGNSHIKRAS
jgi:hypothetical protein